METILGLLLILLPAIFRLIVKKFEQSGNPQAADKVRKVLESMTEEDGSPVVEWFNDEPKAEEPLQKLEPEPQPAPIPVYMPPVVEENVVRQTVTPKPAPNKPVAKKPILLEDEKKAGEKIDTKKLVIYSEIMKPKFTE